MFHLKTKLLCWGFALCLLTPTFSWGQDGLAEELRATYGDSIFEAAKVQLIKEFADKIQDFAHRLSKEDLSSPELSDRRKRSMQIRYKMLAFYKLLISTASDERSMELFIERVEKHLLDPASSEDVKICFSSTLVYLMTLHKDLDTMTSEQIEKIGTIYASYFRQFPEASNVKEGLIHDMTQIFVLLGPEKIPHSMKAILNQKDLWSYKELLFIPALKLLTLNTLELQHYTKKALESGEKEELRQALLTALIKMVDAEDFLGRKGPGQTTFYRFLQSREVQLEVDDFSKTWYSISEIYGRRELSLDERFYQKGLGNFRTKIEEALRAHAHNQNWYRSRGH